MMEKIKSSDLIISERLNTFLKDDGIDLSSYTNLEFIVKVNKIFAPSSRNLIDNYSWKRRGSKFKPVLYLQNINKIIQYSSTKNCFKKDWISIIVQNTSELIRLTRQGFIKTTSLLSSQVYE